MRLVHYLLAAGLLLGSGSCATPRKHSSGSELDAIADTINVAMRDYFQALRARDGERAVSHFAPDFWAFSGGQIVTYDSAVAGTRRLLASVKQFEGDWDRLEVKVLNPSAAIAVGSLWQRYTDTTGQVTAFRGTVSWIWVRRGADWRAVFLHAAPESRR